MRRSRNWFRLGRSFLPALLIAVAVVALGLVLTNQGAAAASKYYSEGAPMEVFYELSEKQGILRPVTPGYVVQSRVFQKAVSDIADGADVATALDAAVDEIDADIEANQGYGHIGG